MSDTPTSEDLGRQVEVLQRLVVSYRERLARVEEELVTAAANLAIAQERIDSLSGESGAEE
jgi:hypothetical protein